ncbi:MAG: hypothetical protein CMQ40_12800 [Gammaproteobacteria bacterium]|nr:hypothetical protein [Gammaproteobacteria bacterium]
MINWLKGKKTYLVAAGAAVVVFVHAMGWLSADQSNTVLGLLGAGGIAALRAGVSANASG